MLFNRNEDPPQDSVRIRNQENNAGHSDDLEQIDDFNLQDDHVVIFIWIETLIFVLLSFDELFPTFFEIRFDNEGKVPWRKLMGRLSESQYSLKKQQACVIVPDPILIFRNNEFKRKKRENIQHKVFLKILERNLLVIPDWQIPFRAPVFEEELEKHVGPKQYFHDLVECIRRKFLVELVYFKASVVETDESGGHRERGNQDLPKVVPSVIHCDDKVIHERLLFEPVLLLVHLLLSHHLLNVRIF